MSSICSLLPCCYAAKSNAAASSSSSSWSWSKEHGLCFKLSVLNPCSSSKVPTARATAAARRHRRAHFGIGLDSDDEDEEDWEQDIFEDSDGIMEEEEKDGSASERIRERSSRGDMELGSVERDENVNDWAGRARQRAVLSIQERGLPVDALLNEKRKKKKKKNRKKKDSADAKFEKSFRADIDRNAPPEILQPSMDNPFMSALGSGDGFGELARLGKYWKNLGHTGEIAIQENVPAREVEFFIQEDVQRKEVELLIEEDSGVKNRVSRGPQRASSGQRRQEDFELNRSLVEASSAGDVLSAVSSSLEDSPWARGEHLLLSPTNISTALHRIAKHMEAKSMDKSDRLSFSRQKAMALLVSAATESFPQCSAQSISNIAWALSKVGGSSLYGAEMDLLAHRAMSNILDLEPQHIANIAGAFASMQHSVPVLFKALDQRASILHRDLQSQELAQLLWAFAALNEPAKLLLDSLDSECETSEHAIDTTLLGSVANDGPLKSCSFAQSYFSSFTLSQLFSLSWSYTVLEELKRPSFALLWHQIVTRSQRNSAEVQALAGQSVQLSQLHQASLSLELEYPELNLHPGEPLGALAQSEWNKLKVGKMSTSTTQKDVEILLVSTGRRWIGEYCAASHSVDIALEDERIALEIDGPTHFARNTGTALGHTVLKRRQLSAAGWTVLSIPYLEGRIKNLPFSFLRCGVHLLRFQFDGQGSDYQLNTTSLVGRAHWRTGTVGISAQPAQRSPLMLKSQGIRSRYGMSGGGNWSSHDEAEAALSRI